MNGLPTKATRATFVSASAGGSESRLSANIFFAGDPSEFTLGIEVAMCAELVRRWNAHESLIEVLRAVIPYAESRAEDILEAVDAPAFESTSETPHDCATEHPGQVAEMGTCMELAQKAALAVEKAKDLLREIGGAL